jgi:hypothetical protein
VTPNDENDARSKPSERFSRVVRTEETPPELAEIFLPALDAIIAADDRDVPA